MASVTVVKMSRKDQISFLELCLRGSLHVALVVIALLLFATIFIFAVESSIESGRVPETRGNNDNIRTPGEDIANVVIKQLLRNHEKKNRDVTESNVVIRQPVTSHEKQVGSSMEKNLNKAYGPKEKRREFVTNVQDHHRNADSLQGNLKQHHPVRLRRHLREVKDIPLALLHSRVSSSPTARCHNRDSDLEDEAERIVRGRKTSHYMQKLYRGMARETEKADILEDMSSASWAIKTFVPVQRNRLGVVFQPDIDDRCKITRLEFVIATKCIKLATEPNDVRVVVNGDLRTSVDASISAHGIAVFDLTSVANISSSSKSYVSLDGGNVKNNEAKQSRIQGQQSKIYVEIIHSSDCRAMHPCHSMLYMYCNINDTIRSRFHGEEHVRYEDDLVSEKVDTKHRHTTENKRPNQAVSYDTDDVTKTPVKGSDVEENKQEKLNLMRQIAEDSTKRDSGILEAMEAMKKKKAVMLEALEKAYTTKPNIKTPDTKRNGGTMNLTKEAMIAALTEALTAKRSQKKSKRKGDDAKKDVLVVDEKQAFIERRSPQNTHFKELSEVMRKKKAGMITALKAAKDDPYKYQISGDNARKGKEHSSNKNTNTEQLYTSSDAIDQKDDMVSELSESTPFQQPSSTPRRVKRSQNSLQYPLPDSKRRRCYRQSLHVHLTNDLGYPVMFPSTQVDVGRCAGSCAHASIMGAGSDEGVTAHAVLLNKIAGTNEALFRWGPNLRMATCVPHQMKTMSVVLSRYSPNKKDLGMDIVNWPNLIVESCRCA